MLAARSENEHVASSYEQADQTYAAVKDYLSSVEANTMSESAVERELDRRGRELMRQLRLMSA